jgi:Protein of unknown function (DUF1214)
MIDKPAPDTAAGDVSSLVSSEWAAYIEPLLPLAERLSGYVLHPEDRQIRQEFYRALVVELAAAYFGRVYADARHPDFWPFTTPAFNAYLNNPDDDYYATPIDDDGVYRISGFRGTTKMIDFQIGAGSFLVTGALDEHNLGTTLANYDLDEHATMAEDGSFDVILSRARPAGWDGDWWELHEGATNILNRQISYDWVGEVDGRYGIERLDVPAIKPRPTAEELQQRLRGLPEWIEGSMRATCDFVGHIRAKIGVNTLEPWALTSHLAIPTQQYVYGGFDLEPDDALVIEFQVPKVVRYWSIHLGDDLGFMLDWLHHHTIINGHTAIVDADGGCRVAVSAQDPGIPNWLDTMGYTTGAMSLRWERCDAYPEEHKVTKVKIGDVRDLLPSSTPVVSPEARDAVIRLRRKGAQMRKRW